MDGKASSKELQKGSLSFFYLFTLLPLCILLLLNSCSGLELLSKLIAYVPYQLADRYNKIGHYKQVTQRKKEEEISLDDLSSTPPSRFTNEVQLTEFVKRSCNS